MTRHRVLRSLSYDQSIIGLVGPTFSGETRAVMQPLQEASLVM